MPTYQAYGLQIDSEIVFPELLAGDSGQDVTICLGPLDPPPLERYEGGQHSLHLTPTTAYLSWEGVGTFRVEQGRDIVVAPDAGVLDETIRLFVLGPVFGVLLHQRGNFVLHASAVAVGETAVAFLGWKGWGKSTLAAALETRGHRLITDDILAVDVSASPVPLVAPAFPQLKLWPDAAIATGHDPAGLRALHPLIQKGGQRIEGDFPATALPLRRLYVLDYGSALALEPVQGSEAVTQLLSHSYSGRFLGQAAVDRRHFAQITRVVSTVRIQKLTRVRDLSVLPQVLDLIEADVATTTG